MCRNHLWQSSWDHLSARSTTEVSWLPNSRGNVTKCAPQEASNLFAWREIHFWWKARSPPALSGHLIMQDHKASKVNSLKPLMNVHLRLVDWCRAPCPAHSTLAIETRQAVAEKDKAGFHSSPHFFPTRADIARSCLTAIRSWLAWSGATFHPEKYL